MLTRNRADLSGKVVGSKFINLARNFLEENGAKDVHVLSIEGAMEVMVPVMQTGMWAGMVVGMWQAMSLLSGTQGALLGAATGLVVINVVWILNMALRGQQQRLERLS